MDCFTNIEKTSRRPAQYDKTGQRSGNELRGDREGSRCEIIILLEYRRQRKNLERNSEKYNERKWQSRNDFRLVSRKFRRTKKLFSQYRENSVAYKTFSANKYAFLKSFSVSLVFMLFFFRLKLHFFQKSIEVFYSIITIIETAARISSQFVAGSLAGLVVVGFALQFGWRRLALLFSLTLYFIRKSIFSMLQQLTIFACWLLEEKTDYHSFHLQLQGFSAFF